MKVESFVCTCNMSGHAPAKDHTSFSDTFVIAPKVGDVQKKLKASLLEAKTLACAANARDLQADNKLVA